MAIESSSKLLMPVCRGSDCLPTGYVTRDLRERHIVVLPFVLIHILVHGLNTPEERALPN